MIVQWATLANGSYLISHNTCRFKLSLYSQKEVINARMLGNFVPDNSRDVIQMNGNTRDLFYYPKSTIQVAVYNMNAKPGEPCKVLYSPWYRFCVLYTGISMCKDSEHGICTHT